MKVEPADMKELTSVDKEGWKAELPLIKEHFATFGAKLPKALNDELAALEKRLGLALPQRQQGLRYGRASPGHFIWSARRSAFRRAANRR